MSIKQVNMDGTTSAKATKIFCRKLIHQAPVWRAQSHSEGSKVKRAETQPPLNTIHSQVKALELGLKKKFVCSSACGWIRSFWKIVSTSSRAGRGLQHSGLTLILLQNSYYLHISMVLLGQVITAFFHYSTLNTVENFSNTRFTVTVDNAPQWKPIMNGSRNRRTYYLKKKQ